MHRLFIEVDDEQYDAIDTYAEENGISIPNAILHAVDNFFSLDVDDDDDDDSPENPDDEEDDDD